MRLIEPLLGYISARQKGIFENIVEALFDSAPVLKQVSGNARDNAILEYQYGHVDDFVDGFVAQVVHSFKHGRNKAAGTLGNFHLDIQS